MQLKQFLLTIRQLFSPSEAQQILAALRHDALVWKQFADQEFREMFVSFAHNDPQFWRPINAAILSMDIGPEIKTLARNPKAALPEGLKKIALEEVEEAWQVTQPSFTLRSAVLTAFGLREQFKTAGNWNAVISRISMPARRELVNRWKTVLVCLSGVVDAWEPVQETLIETTSVSFYTQVISHVILTSPRRGR